MVMVVRGLVIVLGIKLIFMFFLAIVVVGNCCLVWFYMIFNIELLWLGLWWKRINCFILVVWVIFIVFC